MCVGAIVCVCVYFVCECEREVSVYVGANVHLCIRSLVGLGTVVKLGLVSSTEHADVLTGIRFAFLS